MCGINGLIRFADANDRGVNENIVHIMNERIIHRGPDHEGLYADDNCAFGMRRLSIIDLEGGNQPIWNKSHDKLIVFNGEIYNYRDLKDSLIADGKVFYTNSDTEVILLGYEVYGVSFFEKLDGMFAFAIYDFVNHQCIIARDRMGEKPLYYYKDEKILLFGSELKSLLSTGLIKKEIDEKSLSCYFQLTYIPAPMSIIKNVKKLEAATYMVINNKGDIKKEKYWDIIVEHDEKFEDYEYCKKQLKSLLYKSVEKRMISDVPIGAFLSGGFDSSIIVGVMSDISDKPCDTFTIGFKEKQYDESELARLVSKKNKTHHHVVMLDWNEAQRDIDKILDNIDEPFADPSLIATYEVSKKTREYVKVALTGDAGDELFAGYDKYLISYYSQKYNKIPKPIRKGLIEYIVKVMPYNSNFVRKANKVINNASMDIYEQRKRMMSLGFKLDESLKLMPGLPVNSMDFIKRDYEYLVDEDEQKRTQYADIKTVLEGCMLPKVDRASMLASLETRVPLLGKDIIELAFNVPTKYKIDKSDKKIILKDTFRDMLPDELFKAPKHGFNVPIREWLENELFIKLKKYSSEEFIEKQGLFDYNYVQNLINIHMSHKVDKNREIWTFYVFQNWYERYILN